MRKICWTNCKKYKEFKKPKISYICDETLLLSGICDNCGNKDEEIFKERESIEILKILGLINNLQEYQMKEEKISQDFRLKNIDEVKNYFIKEIDRNDLMSRKNKNFVAF